MKKLFLTTAFSVMMITAFAQIGVYNGKPRFNIEARRGVTTIGNIVVEMYPAIAPLHVRNFDSLVSEKFYDTTAFHRVIPGFVIQGGDPNSRHGPRSTWGFGNGSQATVPAEFNPVSHLRGVFSAARSTDINSATSQFFICVANATSLDNNYTAYGRVTSGMNIADSIVLSPRDAKDNPITKIEMFVTRISDDSSETSSPVPTQPADSATEINSFYQFKWSAVTGAQIYELELADDPSFDTILIRKKTRALLSNVPELELTGKRYYWRVKANNGGFLSDSAEIRTFTSKGGTGISATSAKTLNVYPNPSSGKVSFEIPSRLCTMKIYDLNGKLMHTEELSNKEKFTLDVSAFPNGIYYYTLTDKNNNYQGKFSVVK